MHQPLLKQILKNPLQWLLVNVYVKYFQHPFITIFLKAVDFLTLKHNV